MSSGSQIGWRPTTRGPLTNSIRYVKLVQWRSRLVAHPLVQISLDIRDESFELSRIDLFLEPAVSPVFWINVHLVDLCGRAQGDFGGDEPRDNHANETGAGEEEARFDAPHRIRPG